VKETDRIREYFGRTLWRASAGRAYLVEERVSLLRSAVNLLATPTRGLSVCDVGCGTGHDLRTWRDAGVPGASLAGTELVPERAAAARAALPQADIRAVDGFDLPFATDTFDLCSASLVLSTIIQAEHRRRLLMEMARVTAPGGIVVVYDFVISKPWNREVRRITARSLQDAWRRPDRVLSAAPLLPALDAMSHLPRSVSRRLIPLLPRTHRVWLWRVPALSEQED